MLGTYDLVNPLHNKAAPWCLVLNPTLCIKCKPWDLVLKKYCQVGRWVASLGPAMIASLCSMKMGCLCDSEVCGHHCTQLRLGVVSPVGRDGRPPTLIRVGPRTEGGRKRER